jgi:hypothetical protein
VVGPPLVLFSFAAGIGGSDQRLVAAGLLGGAGLTVVGPVMVVAGFGRAFTTLPQDRRGRPQALILLGLGTWFVGAVGIPALAQADVEQAPFLIPVFYVVGLTLFTVGASDAIVRGRRTHLDLRVAPAAVPGGAGVALTGQWSRR